MKRRCQESRDDIRTTVRISVTASINQTYRGNTNRTIG